MSAAMLIALPISILFSSELICEKYRVKPQIQECKCDNITCTLDNDCCPIIPSNSGPPNEHFNEISSDFIRCQSTELTPKPSAYIGDSYYMVSSCPSAASSTDTDYIYLAKNCTELKHFPPATDSSTGIIFRNIFCAICHGFDFSSMLIWRTNVICFISQQQNITIEMFNESCVRQSYSPPKNSIIREQIKWCIPVVANCASSAEIENSPKFNVATLCRNGPFIPVLRSSQFNENLIYKNIFCAMCNGASTIYNPIDPGIPFASRISIGEYKTSIAVVS